MSEPRRSTRARKPVLPVSNPSAKKSKQTKVKTAPISRASLAGLPVELQTMIFSAIPRPSMHRIDEHGADQAQIAHLSLICKSTLGAARSALHLAPFFKYRGGAPRTALIKAFGLDEEEGNAFGRMMERFTCSEWPFGSMHKAQRTTFLAGVLESASLATLHLATNRDAGQTGVRLREVTLAVSAASKSYDSLVNIRLEGFIAHESAWMNDVAQLCSLASLCTLFLVLRTEHWLPAKPVDQFAEATVRDSLKYLHIENMAMQWTDFTKFIRRLPRSIITLSLRLSIWQRNQSSVMDPELLLNLPNLKYLACSCPNLQLPDTIVGLYRTLEYGLRNPLHISSQIAYFHNGHFNPGLLTQIVDNNNLPALRRVSTQTLGRRRWPDPEADLEWDAAVEQLKDASEKQGIDFLAYQTPVTVEEWLTDIENSYGHEAGFESTWVPC